MKKIVLVMMTALVLGACSSHDVEYNPTAQITEEYNKAFKEYVGGEIHPDQAWGFDQDFSSVNKTRAANTNGNIWFKTWERPYNVNLSAAELAELKGLFEKGVPTTNTEIFPYENYYVEQIYKGESSDVAYDKNGNPTNTSVTGSNQMDHLQARDGNNYTHINNFNYGKNETQMVDEGNGTRYVGITLMENMSLNGITANNQFGYSESWGTENGKFYNNYIMVQYKGEWYVGFDFESHKNVNNPGEARDVNRDWNFTDWIVRVSPAVHKHNWSICVIGEDLTFGVDKDSDFDFNDVVFDVAIENGETWIRLLAAGGTLPLYIDGLEVHQLFGVSQTDMVNTGRGPEKSPVIVKLNNSYSDAKSIPVKVIKNGGEVYLEAKQGEPASKVGVPVGFTWCRERVSIKGQYPLFADWATTHPELVWW